MTRKQMKKLAKELYQCELTHSDKSASTEAKGQAEKRIIQLTNWIMALPDGITTMLEIDLMVQEMVSNNEI